MKALYSLEQAINADYYLALIYIDECFEPDLNSMEVQDTAALAEAAKTAKAQFTKVYRQINYTLDRDIAPEIREVVVDAINLYQKKVKEDKTHYRVEMLNEAKHIRIHYLKLMRLLVRLGECIDQDYREKKLQQHLLSKPVMPQYRKLADNPFIQAIAKHQEIAGLADRLGANPEESHIRRVLRILRKEETYKVYLEQAQSTLEEELNIVIFILRDLILKNEAILEHFVEEDLNWKENRSIVRNMALKTIKGMNPEESFEVYELSRNWEDDKEFYTDLYDEFLKNSRSFDQDISKKLQNWDLRRISIIDRVVLKLALTEMVRFPSIPVKVSINEFVEMAKIYGTPKSKDFVNGLLDSISASLMEEGRIRKSGRGLIDNQ